MLNSINLVHEFNELSLSTFTVSHLQFPYFSEDYRLLFAGNTDDNFLIGLSLGKKSLKLYTKLYASDLVIASPVALRMLIGAEG